MDPGLKGSIMTLRRKLIVAGLLVAAIAGPTGVAMAANGGPSGTSGNTKSYTVPNGHGSGESGTSRSTSDAPGLSQGGTPGHGDGAGDNMKG
jgi:hypothetical protein